jgi:hypothetical protein
VSLSENLRFLLSRPTPFACLVKGQWGVGKTFFLKKFVEENAATFAYGSIAYCSLFGKDTLASVEAEILLNTKPTRSDGLAAYQRQLGDYVSKIIGWVGKSIPKVSVHGFDLNSAKDFVVANIASAANRNKIIIIDDLERRSPKISAQDILGLFSTLKEQKNCQIIVIANDGRFDDDDRKIYDLFKEKLFEREMIFQGSPADATKIAFMGEAKYAYATELCSKLNISNIRVVQRIKLNIDEFYYFQNRQVEKLNDKFDHQIQSTIALATWADLTAQEVTLADMQKLSGLSSNPILTKSLDLDERQKAAFQALHNVGYDTTDELDAFIIDFISTGHLDPTKYLEITRKSNELLRNNILRAEISKGWDLLHASLADNKGEIIAQFTKALNDAIEIVTLSDLNGPLEVLRGFGASTQADQIVEAFFARTTPPLADMDYPVWKPRDAMLAERLERFFATEGQTKSLKEAIEALESQKRISKNDIKIIASAPAYDILALIKSVHPRTAMSFLHALLKSPPLSQDTMPDMMRIRATALKAVEILRSEDETNFIRFKWILQGEGLLSDEETDSGDQQSQKAG